MKKPDASRTSHISSHDLVALWKHLGDTYVALNGFRTDHIEKTTRNTTSIEVRVKEVGIVSLEVRETWVC